MNMKPMDYLMLGWCVVVILAAGFGLYCTIGRAWLDEDCATACAPMFFVVQNDICYCDPSKIKPAP